MSWDKSRLFDSLKLYPNNSLIMAKKALFGFQCNGQPVQLHCDGHFFVLFGHKTK